MFLRIGSPALLMLSVVGSSETAYAQFTPQTPISFVASSCFNVDLSAYPIITYFGPDTLDIVPFGPTLTEWHITVLLTATGVEFVEGSFVLHIKNLVLIGEYSDFAIDSVTGAYTLEWDFNGGTGKFRRVYGDGLTNGVANLTTFCANYSFSGTLYNYTH